jgi:hypothetical protein
MSDDLMCFVGWLSEGMTDRFAIMFDDLMCFVGCLPESEGMADRLAIMSDVFMCFVGNHVRHDWQPPFTLQ